MNTKRKYKPGDKVICKASFFDRTTNTQMFTAGKTYTVKNTSVAFGFLDIEVEQDDRGSKNGWAGKFFMPYSKLAALFYS